MQRRSYGSVSVTWLDRERALRAIKAAARRLGRRRREIKKIVLFGSLARGDAVPGSDADLLVVLSSSDLRYRDRQGIYRPHGFGGPIDVFPYTEDEIASLLSDRNAFLREALDHGIVLFDRRKGGDG